MYHYPRTACSYLHRRIAHLQAVIPRLPSPVREVLEAELKVRVAHLDEFKECFPQIRDMLICGAR